jgi:hypothetical protein
MTRALPALVLVAVVGCGTTDLTGRPDASHDPTIDDLTSEEVPSEDTTEIEPVCEDRDGDGYLDEVCGGDDCDDGDPDTYPGAPETCGDGVDQDCDGSVDGPILLDPVSRVASMVLEYPYDGAIHIDAEVDVAWTGSEFGVAWTWTYSSRGCDYCFDGIEFATLTSEGEISASPGLVISEAFMPALSWADGEYGLFGSFIIPGYQIALLSLLPDGTARGDAVDVTPGTIFSHFWTGSEYGLSYYSYPGRYLFNRFDSDGSALGTASVVSSEGESMYYSTLTWTGSEYGLAMSSDEKIDFTRLDTEGSPLSYFTAVSGGSYGSSMVNSRWTGSEYLLTWTEFDVDHRNLMLARIDATDEMVGEHSVISDSASHYYDVAWTGSYLAVVYNHRDEPGYSLHLALVHDLGWIEDTTVVTDLGGDMEEVAITWTGSELGVVWEQSTIGIPGDHGLYIGRIGFCE